MINPRPSMLPLGRVIQRRLIAVTVAVAFAATPVLPAAAAGADVDALWNQPEGLSVDSAFYVVQSWWDGLTRATQSDPARRGLDELAQANADLLNAYTLLQRQRTDPGAQPVAVLDPLLAGIYNVVTGSQAKAPIGSLLGWLNQSVVRLEGRGSTNDIVRALLQDYQARQSSAQRDLKQSNIDVDGLWTANAQRASAFLVKLKAEATPGDGLMTSLNDAEQSTVALAATHQDQGRANGLANGKGNGIANGKDKGKPLKASPTAQPKPKK
jgi:hypothetical protein